jgi:hypothetical protein
MQEDLIDSLTGVNTVYINQGNKEEQGHLVQQMGKIYSQADLVVFWLGLATLATNVLMDSLKQLREKYMPHAYKDWKPTDKRSVDHWLAVKTILR